MLCLRWEGHYHSLPFIKFYLKCHDMSVLVGFDLMPLA